jgi:hypothetical protein
MLATLSPPGTFLILMSIRGWVNIRVIVGLEGGDSMTSLRIELTTFQLLT